MAEVDFQFEVADFNIDRPIIITHSDFEWDDELKKLVRVDKEHIYYETKKGDTN